LGFLTDLGLKLTDLKILSQPELITALLLTALLGSATWTERTHNELSQSATRLENRLALGEPNTTIF
jgi:hypothetical protein